MLYIKTNIIINNRFKGIIFEIEIKHPEQNSGCFLVIKS